MKKNLKRFFSLILCFAMVCSLSVTQAQAVSYNGSCGENLTWTFETDTGILEISGTGKMKDWSASSTKPWDPYKSDIRTVIINSGVTSIGSYAFGYFKSLSKIIIPDTVTVIGSSAFKYCTAFYEFNMPDSIKSIGNEAFYGCKIKNINLPENLTDMGYRVFTFCDALESIVLPEKLQTIGMYAFSYCTSMKKAEIRGNTSFGNGIFYGCSALEYIHISVKTKNISNNAFLNTTPYICAAVKGCDAEIFANNNGHEFRLCDTHEENAPILVTGFELVGKTKIDSGIISGLDESITSLDKFTKVFDGYRWEYELTANGFGTGTKAIIKKGDLEVGEYTVLIYGDVDGNGRCDGQDAFIVKLITEGFLSESDVGEVSYKAADCNFDGLVNNFDVELLTRAGLMLGEIEQYETDIVTNSEEPTKLTLYDIIITIITYIKNLLIQL